MNGESPLTFHESTISLIYKKGNVSEPRSWRPITLSNTMAKLFTSIIASRFQKHLTQYLVDTQKGFMKIDGCHQHAFTIMRAIDDVYLTPTNPNISKDLFLLFIDFTNAFGSMELELLTWSLEGMGLSSNHQLFTMLKSLNENNFSYLSTVNGSNPKIYQERGVKQGCPLSPLLFLFAIDPITRFLAKKTNGYQFNMDNSITINNLGYADDLVYLCSKYSEVVKLVKSLDMQMTWYIYAQNILK